MNTRLTCRAYVYAVVVENSRETKVGDFDVIICAHQDVRGSQIPMYCINFCPSRYAMPHAIWNDNYK